jgi:mannose-1-phosphate guanylyltransferase
MDIRYEIIYWASMKGMILAAGEATRLRPLTERMPKVMVPLHGLPLLQHMLSWLSKYGVREIMINLHHLGEIITEYCQKSSNFGLDIRYSDEEVLTGTAGAVKTVDWFFDTTFLVVYGDVLTNLDIGRMIRYHQGHRGIATIAVEFVSDVVGKGVVNMDETDQITWMTEKPTNKRPTSGWVNGGVYIFEPEILKSIPDTIPVDFSMSVFPYLIEKGVSVYGYKLSQDENLVDIGTWEGYEKGQELLLKGGLLWGG